MNNIYPTVATVTNVYTDIITAVVVEDSVCVEDDATRSEWESNIPKIDTCIIIIDDNTDSIVLTNVVSDRTYGNLYICKCCIIITALFGLFIVVGTFVLIYI